MLTKLNSYFSIQIKTLVYNVISIRFNGKKLIPVEKIKYLGMYLDKHLSWNHHIQELSKKLSRASNRVHKMFSLKYYLNDAAMLPPSTVRIAPVVFFDIAR